MLTAIIAITSITQIILSLFVFSRARNNLSNRLFFFIGIASLGWALSNYLTIGLLHSPNIIYIVRSILFFVVIQNASFYLFARTFPDSRWKYSRKWLLSYVFFTFLAAIATLSPYVFTAVVVKGGLALTTAGPAIVIFILHAAFSITTAFRALVRKIRSTVGVKKRQFQILFFASFLTWAVVPITNFALTPLLKTTFFIRFSPLYTLAFASIIAYAIVVQKLFDIRSAVARSVGYLMIVASMVMVYGLGLFGVIDVLFRGPEHELLRQVLSVVLITPLALIFQRTKSFFDRVTNRLFYRNSYDIKEVLDRLGSVVVSEIDLHRVLNSTRRVLTDALQSSFIEFVLLRDGEPSFEAVHHAAQVGSLDALTGELHKQHRDLLLFDELSTSSQVREQFSRSSIALSLRLKTRHQVVGYIIFGDKRSGDIYGTQDKQLLSIVANELAIAIQNALRFEEIENFNLTLQQRVIDATKKLRRANEELKEVDEAKDDFISMASHQLRTPLTSIKGYTSMVLEGDAGKVTPTQEKLLKQSFVSAQRMVYLISDLLNVSRLRTGKFIIETAPVNLATIIEQELDQLRETAAARSLTLAYKKTRNFPDLMLDETKTRQVIMNFADNAIYYTPSGGTITVELLDKPESIEMTVTDDGIGVPRSEQQHLFTKFYRARNARKARPDGTGLGLFMAKKVIIAQGGALIFHSHEGQGSTFGFTLPKSIVAPPKAKS